MIYSLRFLIAAALLIAASLPLILLPKRTTTAPAHTPINVITTFAETPLHLPIKSNDIERVRTLIALHPSDINGLDTFGDSPLTLAIERDSLEIATLLLQHGADIAYAYQRTETPEARKRARALYPVNLKSNEILNGLDLDKEILEELTSPSMEESMVEDMLDLHFSLTEENAISHCHSLQAIQLIVQHGGDINHVDATGYWPLASFAESNDLPAVKWLLAHGADPNTTSTGETALFHAVSSDNLEMVDLIVASGATINTQDCDGWTPLCRTQSLAMAKLLIQLGADPNIQDQASMPCWDWVKDPEAKLFLKKSAGH